MTNDMNAQEKGGGSQETAGAGTTWTPPPPQAKPTAGRGAQDSGQKALLCIGIAVLAVVFLGCAFGLGYFMGDQHATVHRLAMGGPGQGPGGSSPNDGLQRGQQGQGQQGQGGRIRERVQQMLQDPDNDLLRGSVASVQDSTVAVDTPRGRELVKVTEQTRALGGGKSSGGAGSLAAGDRVVVLVKRAADGGWEAVALKVTETGQGQQKQ